MPELGEAREAAGFSTAQLGDGATAYVEQGSSGPWVVLVHGLVTPSFAWEPLADFLVAAGFRVLRYDQLGRGFSDRPTVRYDLDLYVRQLRQLLREIGIDEVHLVGWSMGGVVITQYAAEHPDEVASLTLVSPGLYVEPPLPGLLLKVPGMAKVLARRAAALVDGLVAQHLADLAAYPDYTERAREQLRFPGMAESLGSTIVGFPWRRGDEWAEVGRRPRPVLLVWGDQDPITPFANAAKVQALFPRAELLVVEGARHAPHLDHADLVQPAILGHLRQARGR